MLGKQPIVPIDVGYCTYSLHSYFNLSIPGSYPYILLQTVHSFTKSLSSYFLAPVGGRACLILRTAMVLSSSSGLSC